MSWDNINAHIVAHIWMPEKNVIVTKKNTKIVLPPTKVNRTINNTCNAISVFIVAQRKGNVK